MNAEEIVHTQTLNYTKVIGSVAARKFIYQFGLYL